ncbi:MAG: hypothetical protein GY856_31665 [bacterium]|nr:hypothetical protein [bacterium]
MFTSENHVGRLVELRVRSPVSDDEVLEIRDTQLQHIRRLNEPFVAVTDLRQAYVFPPHIADGFIVLLESANPRLERSGILITESAVFSLQLERALDAVANPKRRAFRSARELEVWLGEVLSEPEKERLEQFLNED